MAQRITRGDAESILNAFGTGGRVILRQGRAVEAAPADFFGTHGSIRPFRASAWDRAHFCAEDWHVILIAEFDGGDRSFSREHAEANLSQVTHRFVLDGAELSTTRTSVSRFLDPQKFGLEEAYYFQEGRIMAPDDLTVGRHELSLRTDDAGRTFRDGITFSIDPAGSAACLGQ